MLLGCELLTICIFSGRQHTEKRHIFGTLRSLRKDARLVRLERMIVLKIVTDLCCIKACRVSYGLLRQTCV